MPPRVTTLLWGMLALALAGVVGGYPFSRSQLAQTAQALSPSLPPVLGTLPPFDLMDQSGQPFESSRLEGRIWIADFFFTSCAGICPDLTRRMAGLQDQLPAEIQLLSFTVDPERDRPPVLAAYARRYGADLARWHFLTGPLSAITELTQQGFRLSVAEGTSPEEPITHSVRFVLVDRQGRIRGYYDSSDSHALQELRRQALALLQTGADPADPG